MAATSTRLRILNTKALGLAVQARRAKYSAVKKAMLAASKPVKRRLCARDPNSGMVSKTKKTDAITTTSRLTIENERAPMELAESSKKSHICTFQAGALGRRTCSSGFGTNISVLML